MQAKEIGEERRAGHLAQVLRVLEHRLQRVAFEEHAALEVAQAIGRGAGGVADHRARLEQRASAAEPCAPAEVDVLEVGEVVVVEAAARQKRRAPRDHVAAAGEENLRARFRLRTRAGGIAKAVLESVAVKSECATDEVDHLPR